MISKLYTGTIAHRRFTPVDHQLSYPIYLYAVDLDDLPRMARWFPFFGVNQWGISAIHNKDYLYPDSRPITEKLQQLFHENGMDDPIASVTLVTSARYFNYVFNPVNFYYCFSFDKRFMGIVAEVNNTYGERHPYLLTQKVHPSNSWFARYEAPKAFHVSPFNRIEGSYHFYFSGLGDSLKIKIVLVDQGKRVMEATLKARALPLTRQNHLKTLIRHPFVPHLSIPRIYAHAFKLYFHKKLTFHPKPVPRSPMTLPRQIPNLIESLCQKIIVIALKRITIGCLTLTLPNRTTLVLGRPGHALQGRMRIIDYGFFPRVVLDGEIGFGEAFMHGQWASPDLVTLMTLLIRNRERFSDGNLLPSLITRIKEKIAHNRRKNTIPNARKNIADHYDLSNAFYELFLDSRMIYSCGIFDEDTCSLEAAQIRKMSQLLEIARVDAGHHLLEIGCGWGGFAVFAAKTVGCRVTGVTLSKAQYEAATARVEREGVADRVQILLEDYRHTQGVFDRIVSIEMIEAVGPQFLGRFFAQCCRLLKPGGTMAFQTIIIPDERYDLYCRQRDWIQKHIFPGGHLPCPKSLNEAIQQHTDFKIERAEQIGPHYATTLAHWQDRFLAHLEEVQNLGFDQQFIFKWIYYLSVCEAGFKTGAVDDVQMGISR